MINEILSKAFLLKEQKYYKKSLELFYKALEFDNSSAELLYEIAELYFFIKKEEHTLSYIEQVLEFNPTHVPSLKLLKKVFLNKGAFSEAEQTAKNIFLITKKDEDLAEVLRLLNIQQKYDKVLNQPINENSAELVYEKSVALFANQDFEKAKTYIEKYINEKDGKDGKDEKLLFLLGKIYYKLSQYNNCYEIFNKISIQKNNHNFINFAGLVELKQGNYKKSIEYFKSAINIEQKNPEYYYNLGNAYFLDNNICFAKKNYHIAISIKPDNEMYNLALAKLYYNEKKYKKALEFLVGNGFESLLMRAIILFDTGYFALALREFENLEKNNQNNSIIIEYKNKIMAELSI